MWVVIIGFLLFILISLVMPWTQGARIDELVAEVDSLRKDVLALKAFAFGKNAPAEESAIQTAVSQPATAILQEPIKEKAAQQSTPAEQPIRPSDEWIQQNQPSPQTDAPKKPSLSFEQQFGARLPVWIGGIALALAGVFMVKYSLESGLLSPMVRLVIGGIFGISLLAGASWMRRRSDVANDARIAQALSGAGIIDLYACLFTATSIYHLLPPIMGFAGMAVVTALAVILSLRHGAPIALLGLIGGFLTPALVGSSEPNAPMLFTYLYAVLVGLFVLIRRKNWWLLSIPAVISAFLWVALWLVTSFKPEDGIWLSLFLIAVATIVITQSKKAIEEGKADLTTAFYLPTVLNYITISGALTLMGVTVFKSHFDMMEWGLFGLLAAGSLALSYFNEKLYGLAPWLSLATSAAMLIGWQGEPQSFALTLSAFALLYGLSGYLIMWRSSNPVSHAALVGASALGYFFIGYDRLHHVMTMDVAGLSIWCLLALLLSLCGVTAVQQIMQRYARDAGIKQKLLAVFTLTSTAFLSIGLTIQLPHEFLAIAFAMEILAVSWLDTRFNIKALRPIAAILGSLFAVLMIPQALLSVQMVADSLVGERTNLPISMTIFESPLVHLGIPALMAAGSSILLRRRKDDILVAIFEYAAIGMASAAAYFLLRRFFHPYDNAMMTQAGFTERSIITNFFFLLGLGCFWIGGYAKRPAVSLSALLLSGIALARIVYFDFLIHNPLWSHQSVGSMPIFNALLLPYGLPIIWLIIGNTKLPSLGKERYLRYTNSFLLLLAFALVSFNVRQFYHGEYLDGSIISNAEIYTYSAVWLLMGIVLLFVGTLRDDKAMRMASLAVMIVSVGKVFLYDASELTGLLRVFSFLGLGLSLLGLSWFYTRFVFNRIHLSKR